MRVETIGDCTLYLGDCRDVLPKLSGVDAVITDPPYGIGIASNPVRQKHEKKNWDAATPAQDLIKEVLCASERHIIWGGNYFDLPPTQCVLVWDKLQPENFSLAMCEIAWTSLKKPAKIFKKSVLGYDKKHPTQKPVELMKWCIEHVGKVRKIADPFMGSGTTGVACAQMGLEFIGVEMDGDYFDVACRRIEQAYRQPDMFVQKQKQAETQVSLL